MPDHPPDPALAGEQYCYLTTTGRVTGRPHTIEIWFALDGGTLYMLAGGREFDPKALLVNEAQIGRHVG